MWRVICLLFGACAWLRAETLTYWIQPCSAQISKQSTCVAGDAELARWAFDAWDKAARSGIVVATASEPQARIRLYWTSGQLRLYGETHPIVVDGKRGAAIYVNPDVSQLGEEIHAAASHDNLLRDAIVYLTCLHESGHALGLTHTGKFEDIMYSFGFGGDIVEYFERYRRRLGRREDIQVTSAISAYDRQRLLELFRKRPDAALR